MPRVRLVAAQQTRRSRLILILSGFVAAITTVLGASGIEAAQLTLSWIDTSGGQASFSIERKTGSGDFAVIAQQQPGAAGYVDASVALGNLYCYRVLAFNAAGASDYSNEACATPSAGFNVAVVKDGTGTGSVASAPAGINCGAVCSATFPSGTAVTLSATPSPGATFGGWSGASCQGTEPCMLAGNGSVVVNATFAAPSSPPGVAFTDVPPTHPFFTWIEALVDATITAGCSTSPPQYCPDSGVARGPMAAFLLRGIHGGGYQPPAATGMFVDVPVTHAFAPWIEQLAREGIAGGCSDGPPRYCPDSGVTRAQLAVVLLRAKHGAEYQPPAATGIFTDVPLTQPLAAWIEQLARDGITGGCGSTRYCPDATMTRGEMAVFLVRTFNLPT